MSNLSKYDADSHPACLFCGGSGKIKRVQIEIHEGQRFEVETERPCGCQHIDHDNEPKRRK